MQFQVAICDDVLFYVEDLKKYIEEYAKEESKQLEITIYTDSKMLIEEAKIKKYDIIFLDVEMPVLDGIETAREIREFDLDVTLIFVTSHESFSLQATQVEAMGYLVKPVNKERLYRLLKKALLLMEGLQIEKQQKEQYIQINMDYQKISLFILDIVCIRKAQRKLIFYMKDGNTYGCYGILKNIITDLPRNIFFQISRYFIVNINYVENVNLYKLTLKGNIITEEITIRRIYYNTLKKEFLTLKKTKGKK